MRDKGDFSFEVNDFLTDEVKQRISDRISNTVNLIDDTLFVDMFNGAVKEMSESLAWSILNSDSFKKKAAKMMIKRLEKTLLMDKP
jgi:predicted HAD superfamily phosphohydrolase YqeG